MAVSCDRQLKNNFCNYHIEDEVKRLQKSTVKTTVKTAFKTGLE